MGTARHQVITRAFRCGFGQDRGFDIQKTLRIEKPPQGTRHVRTQAQALQHLRAAQVDITEAQTGFFVDLDFINY